MSKETRIFIWGLVLFFIGFFSANHYFNAMQDIGVSFKTIAPVVASTVILIMGFSKISKTT